MCEFYGTSIALGILSGFAIVVAIRSIDWSLYTRLTDRNPLAMTIALCSCRESEFPPTASGICVAVPMVGPQIHP